MKLIIESSKIKFMKAKEQHTIIDDITKNAPMHIVLKLLANVVAVHSIKTATKDSLTKMVEDGE